MGLLCFSHPEDVRMCFLELLNNFCVNSVVQLETETNLNLTVSQRVNQMYMGTVYTTASRGILQKKEGGCLEFG